ncbi:HlyD family efflux transporter periplasmic adaptor subunit [uncultured Parabacteroides sp.]|uniref:HlyD family secretion protein n=1 Tax=uncultured Parabacteroides sp. TaxID=512312 RepID=UPI00258AD7C6|nr:HlyD family efflux transporter periplasmic adaptor subunit [uncultured Parabacteroides sp.]
MKEGKEIELRSEEVQEVMGQIPAWIVRWGITLLFIVVLALLVGSYFFKYPDVITTEMTLTSRHPVAQIVARTSGKISKLYVTDGEKVKPGALLAIVQNPASTEDTYRLKDILLEHQAEPDRLSELLSGKAEFVLGEMQSVYVGLLTSLHECKNYRELDYYPKKIAAVRDQIDKYSVYYRNQLRQRQVVKEQYEIACKQYERDSSLFSRQVISPFEYETAKNVLLQNRYSLVGANAALENMKIQIGQLEESLLDLQLQQAEKESLLLHNYRTAMEELLNVIGSWELNYCLRSPIEGRVTFTKYWNENQFVISGEDVFSVVPEEEERLIGRASLPVQRSGKVELTQRVIVRFANFPDQEFGIVNGIVSAISMVPTEDNYMVEIAFPDGLTTNYGKNLPVSHEMKATAEIVTDDLRLIERFFQPLKKILKEGF